MNWLFRPHNNLFTFEHSRVTERYRILFWRWSIIEITWYKINRFTSTTVILKQGRGRPPISYPGAKILVNIIRRYKKRFKQFQWQLSCRLLVRADCVPVEVAKLCSRWFRWSCQWLLCIQQVLRANGERLNMYEVTPCMGELYTLGFQPWHIYKVTSIDSGYSSLVKYDTKYIRSLKVDKGTTLISIRRFSTQRLGVRTAPIDFSSIKENIVR